MPRRTSRASPSGLTTTPLNKTPKTQQGTAGLGDDSSCCPSGTNVMRGTSASNGGAGPRPWRPSDAHWLGRSWDRHAPGDDSGDERDQFPMELATSDRGCAVDQGALRAQIEGQGVWGVGQ